MPTRSSLRRILILSAALFGAGLQICAASNPKAAAGLDDTVALLTRQSDAWDKAIVRKDKAAIAGNMSEDFRQIGSNGDVADKEEFVRDLTSPDITIDPYTVEGFNVRVYGNVALLSGRTHMTGRQEGKPFKTQYIYIDIYRRINGEWKVCSVQTTRLPS
jgi:ketosteroid isomerase-like protein